MGQAAELLDVQPAFLRSIDAAGVLTPSRSSGGHRRYSRRQLTLAARMRELFDEGMTLDAAARIVGLENELDAARARINELEAQHGVPPGSATPPAGTSPGTGGSPAPPSTTRRPELYPNDVARFSRAYHTGG
jgi:MerR family transcriptional regulator, heat shock protein HspR